MTTAQGGEQNVSIPFDEAGIKNLSGAQSGTAGPSATALSADDLGDLRAAVEDLRSRGDSAAKKVICTANWTERSCSNAGASAAGAKDPGVNVILTGETPGGGTINPSTGSGGSAVPGAVPESPSKPSGVSGEDEESNSEGLLYYPESPLLATAFHRLSKSDGLLVVPGKGIYGARSLIDAGGEPLKSRPLLDLGDGGFVEVAEKGTSCRTFGANPQVVVLPPTHFFASVAVEVKGISVITNLQIDVVPVRASFGRTGRCWEGVCSVEQITGYVISTVTVKLTVRATGAIKIGPIKIGVGNIALVGEVSLARTTSYTLTTG